MPEDADEEKDDLINEDEESEDDTDEEKDDLDNEDGKCKKEDTLGQPLEKGNLVSQGYCQLVGCDSICGTIDIKSFRKQVLVTFIFQFET